MSMEIDLVEGWLCWQQLTSLHNFVISLPLDVHCTYLSN